jgi:hypothetical protein
MKSLTFSVTFLFFLAITACSNQSHSTEEQTGSEDHHLHGPNDGFMVPMWSNGIPVAFAEVKLHDDKGDIELWLTEDQEGNTPFDLELDATIDVIFPELEPAGVILRVRNTDQNEDENGNSTVRNNKTNYFIFPGDTGEDASFLIGKEFETPASLRFTVQGAQIVSETFSLYPHSH